MPLNAHAVASDAAVLNLALLDQYKARKSNLFERLIDAYLAEAPRFFLSIRAAADSKNFDDIRAGAHALKSCSHNLGAVRLSSVCQRLESAALARDDDGVAGAMSAIGAEVFDAEQALRSELFNYKKSAGLQTSVALTQ